MKTREEQIKELEQLIEDYKTILRIHIEGKTFTSKVDFQNYADSILDEINATKREIELLKRE
ncbi:MAG: hypothetical protein LBN27_10715 [Prevotellaceae bacterium]|jgi:hypothetical protein|nr:hypothetical protein [Prevotellaceae bacterium]